MRTNTSANKTELSVQGTFTATPTAFKPAAEGVRNTVKLEFRTTATETPDGEPRFETTIATDRVLFDFGALAQGAIEPSTVARDCDLLKEIALKHPDKLRQLPDLLRPSTPLSEVQVKEAYDLLKSIGLTEEDFVKAGGGMLALALIVAGALLMGSCAHCNQYMKR